MHLRRLDQALVLLAVGREGHAAVEEDFQVRPHFFEMVLAGEFQHARQDREHPGRHAADVGHVFVEGFGRDPLAFDFEIAEQGRFFLRHPHQVDHRIDVLEHNGANVAHERVFDIVVGRVAATQDEGLSVQDAAFRMVAQVIGDGVEAALIVGLVQTFVADGDEFRLVVGGTRRLGKPLDAPGPEDVALPVAHPVDRALEFFVGVDGDLAGEGFIVLDAGETVLTAKLRFPGFMQQMPEDILLNKIAFLGLSGQFFLSGFKNQTGYCSEAHIGSVKMAAQR